MDAALGRRFESEIREQPVVWERLAGTDHAARLAAALDGEVILVGSGSSLFAAELGALALRRRRISAHAVPASETRLDHRAYTGNVVIALSQSGASTDVLEAVERLAPRRLIALTNTAGSPLAERADLAVDIGAGPEIAVPASKSVSATVALLLWTASLAGGSDSRRPAVLRAAAAAVRRWFDDSGDDVVAALAQRIARCSSVILLGSDYGLPIAREAALKLKEAAYVHAEGFAGGEFRHGSVAMVDASCAVIGIVDRDALPTVERPMREVAVSEALRATIGGCAVVGMPLVGPVLDEPYNTLGWLVTVQLLALHVARARGIDGDAPRGLTKALVEAPR